MMKTLGALLFVLLLPAGLVRGEEVVQDLPWTRAPEGATLVAPCPGRAGACVRVERVAGGVLALARLDRPALRATVWALTGEVRYEDVQGQGYLEMWNLFPDGGRYFSRTLADRGPMGALSGSSGWRAFVLPFTSRPDLPAPVALEVNLVLPGRGAVEIGPLRLVQYSPGDDPLALATGAWWSDRQAGLLGGIVGSGLGLLGGLIGWLASRGRGRGFVLAASAAIVALGALAAAAGVVALLRAQPYGVWYPLVLLGVLSLGVMGLGHRRLRARYDEVELRRLRALDVR
jgi:hypothetical protein